MVLAVPNLKLNLYYADEIRRIADVLRSIPLPDGRIVESSGTFVIYTDMLDAVSRDGLIANARIHEALHHQRLDALADRAVSELVRQLREASKKARARRGQMRRR